MRRRIIAGLALAATIMFSAAGVAYSQDIPERPNPPRLVNDYAQLLTGQEVNALEQKLVTFNDSTSTQIAVVIVRDLAGYEPEQYAQRIGEKWGVGQKGKNNGIVILIKPKTAESSGQAFIKPGYGAEGAVPDLICASIVDNEMIPSFRDGNYYNGIDKATNTIMSLIRGEFTADQYSRRSQNMVKKGAPVALFIIIMVIAMIMRGIGRSNNSNLSRGGGLPFWLLLSMMNSGRGSSGGSWGGFSGGGGGGGGFGGFGGGSFGGGGAGGSW
jgi:uncharacterized protein